LTVSLPYFIPCAIFSESAYTFSIGPVRFVHIAKFDSSEYRIVEWERAFASLKKCMEGHGATWLGITKGCWL
jgi:hypothetical protein